MNSDSDQIAEPRDRTRVLWIGFVVAICAMVAAMALRTRGDATKSLVRARHILVAFNKANPVEKERALKQITDLRARIEDGEKFSKLAIDYSQDPYSARRGGDLNYMERGAFADTFEAYVWSAPIGELSDVIESQHGYHLVVVDDRIVSEVDKVIMEQERAVHEQLKQERESGAEPEPEPDSAP